MKQISGSPQKKELLILRKKILIKTFALISAWDRDALCFRFGSFELVPTLEEFSRLLGLSHDTDMLVLPFGRGGKRGVSDLL